MPKEKHVSFQRKILYNNTAIIVVLCLIFFSVFSWYYVHLQREQSRYNMEIQQNTKCDAVEQVLDFAENTATQIRYSPMVLDMFKSLYFMDDTDNYFDDHVSYRPDLYAYLIPYLVGDSAISRICIYNDNGDFVYVGEACNINRAVDYFSRTQIAIRQAQMGEYDTMIHFVDLMSENGVDNSYISMVVPITDHTFLDGVANIGYVEIQIDLQRLANLIGVVEADTWLQLSHRDMPFLTRGDSGIAVEHSLYAPISQHPEFTLTLHYYDGNYHAVVQKTIVSLAFVLVLIILATHLLQSRIIGRITAPLIRFYTQVQGLDFDIDLTAGGQGADEIGQLHQAFFAMMSRVRQSANQLILEKTSRLRVQMLALQAHVNPHFMHNTLGIIDALLEERDVMKAQYTLRKLSSMIRYTANFADSQVTVEQELKHAKDYMELLQIRYEEDFTYAIQVPEMCKQAIVPKFTLQPILENALQHSLKQKEYPWHIVIEIWEEQGYLMLGVSDNGAGITLQAAQDLQDKVAHILTGDVDQLLKHMEIGGYSLMNAMVRMRMVYKNQVKFTIRQNEQGGTTVTIGGYLV